MGACDAAGGWRPHSRRCAGARDGVDFTLLQPRQLPAPHAHPRSARTSPRVLAPPPLSRSYLLLSALFGKRRPKNAPPVWTGGLPIIGHFSDFAANPVETMKQGYKACGSVFTMSFLGNEMTFLVSAEAQVPFYRANDEELSQNEPYKFMTPIFGKGIVFDAPLHIKNQQLKFVSGALRPQALKTYVPQIIAETEEFLKGWGDSGEVDLLDAMSRLIILTASRCLLGREVREHLFEEVASLLHDIDEGLNPLAIFFPNAPLPMFRCVIVGWGGVGAGGGSEGALGGSPPQRALPPASPRAPPPAAAPATRHHPFCCAASATARARSCSASSPRSSPRAARRRPRARPPRATCCRPSWRRSTRTVRAPG